MIHQVSSGFRGTATDINIQVAEVNQLMDTLMEILAESTGKNVEEVRSDCDRDYWMDSQKCKDYGIVDEILGR